MHRLLLLTTLAAGCAAQQVPHVPSTCGIEGTVELAGVVTNEETGERIPDALVVLQSNSLPAARETMTNDDGIYAFRELPAGEYTIQVLSGHANVSKVTTLVGDGRVRANFKIDPEPRIWGCPVIRRPDPDVSLFSISADEGRLLGMPKTTYRW